MYKIDSVARKRHEAWGETFREVGVLLLVFVPLDVYFRAGRLTTTDEVLTLGSVIVSLVLFEIGIRVECES